MLLRKEWPICDPHQCRQHPDLDRPQDIQDQRPLSSKLKQVCHSIMSEGGYELRGTQQGIGTTITSPKTLTTAGTYYPIMWERIVKDYNVKTVLDIGCGRGFSSKYFQSLGCDILGVDGSTQAGEMSLIPEYFLLNDYEGGPALSRSEIEYNDKPIKDFVFDLAIVIYLP